MSVKTTYKPRWRQNTGPRRYPYRNLIAVQNSLTGGYSTVGYFNDGYTIPVTTLPKAVDTVVESAPKPVAEISPYMQQQNELANITPVLTYASPNTDPQPQTQFIDADEFVAISNEGIVIPETANVVVVPVSSGEQPELYNQIVEAKIAEPEKPIADIVYSVINSEQNNIDPVVKEEVIFNQEVIVTKQENPQATIQQIEQAVVNNEPVIVTYVDPSLNSPKVPEVITPNSDVITPTTPKVDNNETLKVTPGKVINDEEQMYIAGSAAIIGIMLLL